MQVVPRESYQTTAVSDAWLQCDPGQIGPDEHLDFYYLLQFEKEENGYHFIKATKLISGGAGYPSIPISTTFQLKKSCYSISQNK